MLTTKPNRRAAGVFLLTAAVFAGFFALLLYRQLAAVHAAADPADTVSSYDITVKANRGEILDRNGNTFVYNEQINTVIFDALTFPADNAAANDVILRLIHLLEKREEAWIDLLPLTVGPDGSVTYAENAEAEIRWLKSASYLYLNDYATAENCYRALLEKYELTELAPADARKVASVRYHMARVGYSLSTPYTFAEDVSVQTIACIKENSDVFPGVDAYVTTKRKYVGDGRTAAHLLGIVGAISAEEYEEKTAETEKKLAEAGDDEEKKLSVTGRKYLMSDKIGKNGLEQAMESYLRGENGVKTVKIDADGNVSESFKLAPQTGGSVITTLDIDMQQVAERSLKKRIMEITDSEALAGGLTPAGAVVVEDVNTGAILASASYPDFSLSTYYEDYETLAADAGKPLWNRAFQSGYSPGSTMKPATAAAGLEEGVITPDSVYYCNGVFQYIDQTFVCFNRTAHGAVNVKTALAHSCNLFFFNIAEQLGIQKLNAYASLFGLGQKTGVEISETEGILAGYDYRVSQGLGWKLGETLLAAIGQSDNSFSVLQLTNYCATIANGGTRYTPYLVSKVLSADYSQVYYERSPEVSLQTNISAETLDAIKEGMYLVANVTSCKPYLGGLEYKVACKTGTAEKTRIINGARVEGTDGFLIAFGPYENPQIAVTVVIENAGSGSSTAQVAADIFNYYYDTLNTVKGIQPLNELL
ncbi:MAG: hypothetical protein IJT27_05240 [Clostridia bacterium]|nr:hypothetical protein [Clostridia bacterium]